MPNWGDILKEVSESAAERGDAGPDLDGIRLKFIRRLHELSGRAVIVYASGWLKSCGQGDVSYSVEGADVHSLMEACHRIPERELDLIIHSPGASPQAAEQMVNYLRAKFDYIRALVPLQAKSAATIIALGCDEIVLGLHSELGPIDPQIPVPTPGGWRYSPAIAILRDFQRAKQEIADDVKALPVWTPILHGYAGGLLEFCTQQIHLSTDIVAGRLYQYMLQNDDCGVGHRSRKRVANKIADYFGSEKSYDRFRSHGRPIRIEELKSIRGLRVRALEDDQDLQDTVLSIYHGLDLTFNGPAIKIVENHLGSRYVRLRRQFLIREP